jgi:hypothetical protein
VRYGCSNIEHHHECGCASLHELQRSPNPPSFKSDENSHAHRPRTSRSGRAHQHANKFRAPPCFHQKRKETCVSSTRDRGFRIPSDTADVSPEPRPASAVCPRAYTGCLRLFASSRSILPTPVPQICSSDTTRTRKASRMGSATSSGRETRLQTAPASHLGKRVVQRAYSYNAAAVAAAECI